MILFSKYTISVHIRTVFTEHIISIPKNTIQVFCMIWSPMQLPISSLTIVSRLMFWKCTSSFSVFSNYCTYWNIDWAITFHLGWRWYWSYMTNNNNNNITLIIIKTIIIIIWTFIWTLIVCEFSSEVTVVLVLMVELMDFFIFGIGTDDWLLLFFPTIARRIWRCWY